VTHVPRAEQRAGYSVSSRPIRQNARQAVTRAARAAVLRPGAVRRIPFGLGRGLRLEADPQTTLHVYLGTAEIEIAGHFRRLARPGCVCFDVGSNNGYYAMALTRLTGVGAVAFEFAPEAIQRIRRNLARNGALGGSVRVVEAYVTSVVDPHQGANTLDRLSQELATVPDLLKIDVEGAELDVLRGAERLLAQRRPHLVVETHGLEFEADCIELLRRHGYRPVVRHQRRWFREGRPNPHNRWVIAPGRDAA
jgi:precorrin-6B methylase 2